MKEFDLQRNVPLAQRTTLGVGGPGQWLARVDGPDQVAPALEYADQEGLEVLVLGGGSNVLVCDRGVDALVLHYADRSCRIDAASGVLHAAAGADWDRVVQEAVEAGLAGIECLRSIPGAVGAAPVQNIGAYGQEIADTLRRVEAIDLRNGRPASFAAEECGFSYRDSHFKSAWRGRHLITAIELQLRPGGGPTLEYPSLADRLESAGRPATLPAVAETVREIRREKGMVYEGAPDDLRSAGSFFTNPVLGAKQVEAVREALAREGIDPEGLVAWPVAGGRVKLSAAWLIQSSGFERGHQRGRAGLSPRHVLALINRGGATAAELLELAREIKERVLGRFGVRLVPEPVPLGFEPDEVADLWPMRA